MQTFLPYASFAQSAAALDMKRLGKQRVENLQIMNVLAGVSTGPGWQNHPVTNMWREWSCALMRYQVAICSEWISHDYRDTCAEKTWAVHEQICPGNCTSGRRILPYMPWWLGDERLHYSHRCRLVFKKPEFYGPLFPDADPEIEYWWPYPKRTG